VAKLREHERLQGQGFTIPQACERIGTFYRWRLEYGALNEDEARRLKALEQENSRLKRVVADLTLDISMLNDLQRQNGEPGALSGGGPPPGAAFPGVGARVVRRNAPIDEQSLLAFLQDLSPNSRYLGCRYRQGQLR